MSFSRPLNWFYHEFGLDSVWHTGLNAQLIILARTLRMFAHGTYTLILALFLAEMGYSDAHIGLFMTLTLLGDVLLGTYLTLIADRIGRRKILLAGSFLMFITGLAFANCEQFWLLLLAAVVGIVSVTGGDFGPFRSIEESILFHLTTPDTRSDVLAWYVTLSGIGSTLGSEVSGRLIEALQALDGWTLSDAYHSLFWINAGMAIVNGGLVLCLSNNCEAEAQREDRRAILQHDGPESDHREQTKDPNESEHEPLLSHSPSSPRPNKSSETWLHHPLGHISKPTLSVMYKLWILLAVDSLSDGMVPYSLTNYYIDNKFHPRKSALGDITSTSYFLAVVGAMFAGPIAKKIGLVNTMVYTHIPSSLAVVLFPFAPVLWQTAALLFVRAGLNNMDQAPRSALIAGVVRPEERTAVMGITSTVRTLAATAGPLVTGLLAGSDRFWIAFVVGGACRLVHDVGLWLIFLNVKLHQFEEV